MKKILVSGLVNIETSVELESFPINYSPIEYPFFGVNSCVSGVGYNVARALKTLGSDIDLLSEVGDDLYGSVVVEEIKKNDVDPKHIIIYQGLETAASVVLVDKQGQRKIYCDLKNIQDRPPLNESHIKLDDYSLAVLTNINFNRGLLKTAHDKGICVATDVHVLSNLDDEYNQDFLKYADILFLSNEAILGKEMGFLREIYRKFNNKIIVCGCSKDGALLYIGEQDKIYSEPAVAPLGIVSTVGAGDALFSSFIHFYNKGLKPQDCLKKAVLFAGIKISQSGGSNGFVSEEKLEEIAKQNNK